MKDKLYIFIALVNKNTFKKVLSIQSVIYWPRKMHNMNNDSFIKVCLFDDTFVNISLSFE